VIVEILNEDGSMARRPDLEAFAKQHDLKIGTIADLIHYRVENEKSVVRLDRCRLPTSFGTFTLTAYRDTIDGQLHLALTYGDITQDFPTLVRVHVQNSLCDLFSANHPDCGWPLTRAMRQIVNAGGGVIVVLRNRDSDEEILGKLRRIQESDAKTPPSSRRPDTSELRTYGIGAQILCDLGIRQMRVMSAPKAMHGISGFELEVVEYVSGSDLPGASDENPIAP
jgi:3,4-dihydroxy 2-butanone 4-phosphate synthase/GTP cyclohydrolase II